MNYFNSDGGVWELGVGGVGDWVGVSVWVGGGEVDFTKEIPLNKIWKNLKMLLKKVRGGQFYKRNQAKRIFWKP